MQPFCLKRMDRGVTPVILHNVADMPLLTVIAPQLANLDG
ncbi:Hypothetical protein I595_3665 [Croceitalea dokdonensis DOKDO 023]|uniref:Uncharacterized protein n=1 Tax=Croceitalea dokdonensis DOKDO 023 TaxID=1300341 RepID=A0A0P7ARA8_9FLAO|nr:Hypothetical protein I595_3665 [Croceitalea dokdonensis DOKDO 023]